MTRPVCRAAAVACALLTAPAAPAAPVPGAPDVPAPTITAQSQPVGRLLEEVKAIARTAGGEDAAKEFQKALEEKLGEKGLTGLDLLRPVAAYVYLTPKIEESWGVLVIPVTTEKDFLDLLERLEFKAERKADGLYEFTQYGLGLRQNGVDVPEGRLRMRFHDRHAYVAVNAKESALEVKNLLPAGKLTDPAEQAPLAVRLDLTALDPALKKQAREAVDGWEKELGNIPPGAFFGAFVTSVAKPAVQVMRRYARPVLDEGERATLRLRADAKAGELAYEVALRAKKGSELAAAIAARKPTTNRFAGILPETGVAGGLLQQPSFAPELRDAGAELADELLKSAEDSAGEAVKPVVAKLRKGAVRTLKAGEVDLGAALTGPDRDGLYTAVAAVGFDDPSGVEKAARAAVKNLPVPFRGAVKFDAAKAGDLSVHAVTVGSLLPAEGQKVFGETAVLHVAFGPKAVYAALGPNGLAELKRVVALKPAAARALDLEMHPKRLKDLITAADPMAANNFAQVIPLVDRMVAVTYVEVRGGAELVVRYGSMAGSLRGLNVTP